VLGPRSRPASDQVGGTSEEPGIPFAPVISHLVIGNKVTGAPRPGSNFADWPLSKQKVEAEV
jgi:hypothetical protein